MNVDDIIKAKVLSELYGKMSEDEKQLLLFNRHKEVMDSLDRSESQIDDISKRIGKHPFASDLVANVVGNYVTEGLSYLFKSLVKKV